MTHASESPLVILGAGGHAKVLLALVQILGREVAGVCDPRLARGRQGTWRGVAVLGDDDALGGTAPGTVDLVNGLGQIVGNRSRTELYHRMVEIGFHFPSLVHPVAWLAPTARIEDGVQIMAGAIIQPDSQVGQNTIINTGARIDHDCRIGPHVHIAPGAVLCGGVSVGQGAFIGAGATILPGVRVEENAVVGAGLTLRHNLAHGHTFTGIRTGP